MLCILYEYVVWNCIQHLEASWFSLEQNSGCSSRQAFIYFSRLHQVWNVYNNCSVPEKTNLLQDLFNKMRNLHQIMQSTCFKRGIHALSIGYFLQYITFYSWPCIIVLVPICSLYKYLAGAITFLYPLATKLFTVYAYRWQSCLLFIPLAPKPLF